MVEAIQDPIVRARCGRSTPASSTSATPRPARRTARPVVLLHGWPYDIHSFAEVAPLLAAAGLPGDRAVPARLRHDAFLSADTCATASRRRSPSTSSR